MYSAQCLADLIYTCPDSGHVITHNCSLGSGVHVSYCPRPAAACARLAMETAELSYPSDCEVKRYTADYTVCACKVHPATSGRRSLTDTTESEVLDAVGATDMIASTVFIASDFADTFSAADDLNSANIKSVVVVVVMLGVVWVSGLGAVLYEWTAAMRDKPKDKHSAESEALQSTLTYVDSVIPKVFERRVSLWRRLAVEVAEHHVLFEMATAGKPKERREAIYRCLTALTLMLFLTAVFFDISNPGDDGSCVAYGTAEACVRRRSPFDQSQTYCVWSDDGAGGTAQCAFNSQRMSNKALFYMTVLTTMLTSVAAIPIDYLFGTLKAPTALSLEGSKVSTVVSSVVSGVRRVSNVGLDGVRRASNAGIAMMNPQRVAPEPSPAVTSTVLSYWSGLFSTHGMAATRELPEEVTEVGDAARASITIVSKNATALALGYEGSTRALRTRSMRLSQRGSGSRETSPKHDGKTRPAEFTFAEEDAVDASLLSDVIHQRLLMNSAAETTRVYDAQWGVLTTGDGGYCILPAAATAIEGAVQDSTEEASRLNKLLTNYSIQHAGLEILHMFMLDLLGRNTTAAKVFKEKFGEEFGHSRVVVLFQKYVAAAILVGTNAFFIYFVVLKGFTKGVAWQYQYLVCCLVQMAVDLLLFETVECAWLNFLVPQYVHDEVVSAAEKLRSLTKRMAHQHGDIEEAHSSAVAKFFLNAPAHLFVSVKVAQSLPQLLESMIVSSYRHHLPGEICKTWSHCAVREDNQAVAQRSMWLRFPRWALRGLALALQGFITVPYAYQKVGLRFAQPVVYSGLALVFYTIVVNPVALALLSLAAAAGAAYAARRWWIASAAANSAMAAVGPDSGDMSVDAAFIESDHSSAEDGDETMTEDDNSVVVSSEDSEDDDGGVDSFDAWGVEHYLSDDSGERSDKSNEDHESPAQSPSHSYTHSDEAGFSALEEEDQAVEAPQGLQLSGDEDSSDDLSMDFSADEGAKDWLHSQLLEAVTGTGSSSADMTGSYFGSEGGSENGEDVQEAWDSAPHSEGSIQDEETWDSAHTAVAEADTIVDTVTRAVTGTCGGAEQSAADASSAEEQEDSSSAEEDDWEN
jgi:hypothetical protein